MIQRICAAALVAVFGSVAVGAFGARQPPPAKNSPAILPTAIANPVEVGFADTLHAGETLSQLLERVRLAGAEAEALLSELEQHQDPRRLRPGSVISYRRSLETGDVRGIDLRLDADRTIALRRAGDGWLGTLTEVPVRTDTVVLTGEVESSLYDALLRGRGGDVTEEERRAMADILAERIFAWQIDFSRDLRAGDAYRILYERLVRPDGTARSGEVLTVQFSIDTRDYEAYLFRAPDGTEDYYERDGESLRRAFLRAPLEFRRISSAFSTRRFHPILKRDRPHWGIDYAASSGTPVRAVGDGVVRKAGRHNGYGNLVEIQHSRGYSTRYAHLRAFAKGIRGGTRVKQGDIIGYVGATGLATAPHLHYEFHSGGKPVNPSTVRFITGDPVPARHLARFREIVRAQTLALNQTSEPLLLADRSDGSGSQSGD